MASTRRNAPWLTFCSVVILMLVSVSTARADVLGDLGTRFESALGSGSFGTALATVFLAGLATSLTPCVYPMIAITVSVFGAREAKTRIEGALLSTSFVLGMAALFTPLGVISALTGMAFGSLLANPIVLVALALLFGAMALSMFGAFELSLPPALQNRLAGVGGAGYRGAFALGFVNGLIAAPCTGPVLAVLLAWVGASGNAGFGALSLFVYSLGLGVLFFVVGTFAIGLPKSGRWLEAVKSVFGVVMLVLALYFVRSILPLPIPPVRSETWMATAIGLGAIGLLLGAVHLSFHGSASARIRKGAGVVLVVVGSFLGIAWAEALPPGAHIEWMDDYATAAERARNERRPLLVDFGADWCGACKEIEHTALSDPRVVAEAKRFVPVRVDLSANKATPEKWALLKEYQQPGLPLVVIHRRDGTESSRITGPVPADEFLRRLREVR